MREVLARKEHSFSFEFFPPKTDEGERQLWLALEELAEFEPDFVSVTYGAGGSTRDRTIGITKRVREETGLVPVGHLTCVGSTTEELAEIVGEYADAGVENILAVRGDPPDGPGGQWSSTPGGLDYADQLVSFVRQQGDFCVGVGAFPEAHPGSGSVDRDAEVLLAKQNAGAEFAITQLFFDPQAYFDLVERSHAVGVTIPIIPGIMPITNPQQVTRMAELSGASIPTEVSNHFIDISEADAPAVGVKLASEFCAALLEGGAPGLHFFTLNRSTATRQIYQELGLPRR